MTDTPGTPPIVFSNETHDPVMTTIQNDLEHIKSTIDLLMDAIGNLNNTNDKTIAALRAVNCDAVDKILGPTNDDLIEEKRRKDTLQTLWSHSNMNDPDRTDSEQKFADLYHELDAVQKTFYQKYYCS